MNIKNLNEVTKFEDFNIHETFRAHMIYEEITGEIFRPDGLKSMLIYFYANVMAANRDLTCDFDQFIDWLDDHANYITNFTEWLTNTAKRDITKQDNGEEAGEKQEPFHNE